MEKQTHEIIDLIKKGRRPTSIAEQLGLPLSDVVTVYNGFRLGGEHNLGRPELRKFIVAVTVAGQGWSDKDRKAIQTARLRYDQGLDEMCTGRDGALLLLYSIPRKKRAQPRDYFFGD